MLYVRSLERLLSEDRLAVLYPGHGPVVGDARGKIQEYIRHRRAREDQVAQAISQLGTASLAQIVAAIYPGLAAPLVPGAERNTRQAADKLCTDGRAALLEGAYRMLQ